MACTWRCKWAAVGKDGWRIEIGAGADGKSQPRTHAHTHAIPASLSPSLPPSPQVHEGSNYLLKILTDFAWFPLPGGSDPFLLRWFGSEASWWHPSYGKVCPPSEWEKRPGGVPPFALDLLAPPPIGELPKETVQAMQHAEGVLKTEARVYDFWPSDGMQPPPHFLELAQEMELIVYGYLGAYEATLMKITRAHQAELARKAAALVLQKVARRNSAVRERRARFLEKHQAMSAMEAMGHTSTVGPHLSFNQQQQGTGSGAFPARAATFAPAPPSHAKHSKSIRQEDLVARLEADERAKEAACVSSRNAHEQRLSDCSNAMSELDTARQDEEGIT